MAARTLNETKPEAKVEFSERRAGALSEGEPTGEDGA